MTNPLKDVDWPPESVVLELGRMTWAAIDLDDAVRLMRYAIVGGGSEVRRAFTGRVVPATVKVVQSWRRSRMAWPVSAVGIWPGMRVATRVSMGASAPRSGIRSARRRRGLHGVLFGDVDTRHDDEARPGRRLLRTMSGGRDVDDD